MAADSPAHSAGTRARLGAERDWVLELGQTHRLDFDIEGPKQFALCSSRRLSFVSQGSSSGGFRGKLEDFQAFVYLGLGESAAGVVSDPDQAIVQLFRRRGTFVEYPVE